MENSKFKYPLFKVEKMYHTALLQKFNGTKHVAAGEKAIKS